MTWYDYENRGWNWSVGWNPNYGGYYAQMWRSLPRSKIRKGQTPHNKRQCLTEGGRSTEEAKKKLWQRIDGLEELTL